MAIYIDDFIQSFYKSYEGRFYFPHSTNENIEVYSGKPVGLKLRLTWLQDLQSQTAALLSLPFPFLFMRVNFSLFYFVLIPCSALVELLKHKPKATEEQLKTVLGDFSAFVEKCCTAADKEACFAEEVPELSSF